MKEKRREIFFYLLFGGIAFFLNIGLFALIDEFTPLNELVNNVICWIICVLFQFFTNRTWVFRSHAENFGALMKQLLLFALGRLATLGMEEAILAVFITWLGLPGLPVKLSAQVIVIVLNYVISKWIVFRKKKYPDAEGENQDDR